MRRGGTWAAMAVAAGGIGLSTGHSTPLRQTAARPPQDAPIVVIGPDADIVVTGATPLMRGGLWLFQRSGTLAYGSADRIPLSNPYRFTVCLPDDDLEGALRHVAGERSTLPRLNRCDRLRLKVADGRITGSRSCLRTPADAAFAPLQNNRLNVSGRYDTRRLTITFSSEDRFDGLERGGGAGWNPKRPSGHRWQVEATRAGDCPLQRRRDQRTLDEAVNRLFDARTIDDTELSVG